MPLKLPESVHEYKRALLEAGEIASMKTLIATNQLKPDISVSEAQRKYGRAIVNRWIREHLVSIRQDGPNAKKRIDRLEIEAVNKASNRGSYLTTKELHEK